MQSCSQIECIFYALNQSYMYKNTDFSSHKAKKMSDLLLLIVAFLQVERTHYFL